MSAPNKVIPTRINTGPRQNKVPALIALGVLVVFALGVFYAALQRVEETEGLDGENGSVVLDMESDPLQIIDILDGKPDGLAGVDPSIYLNDPEKKKRESDIEDRVLTALEQQRLADITKQKSFQESLRDRQIQLAQKAYEGETTLDAFTNKNTDRGYTVQPAAFRPGESALGQAAAPGISPADALASLTRAAVGSRTGNFNIPGGEPSIDSSGVVENREYLQSTTQGRDFQLRRTIEKPTGRYEIKTGSLIPATMISTANSDLPGDLVAQVSQNIYDTRSGRHVLIPQGTKLFGRYDAFTALGQDRLLIVWDRLIFPDTETLDINGMQGYDDRGRSGLKDKVNTHFLSTLANAFLLSVVESAGQSLIDSSKDNTEFVLNLQQSFGENTKDAYTQYLRSRLKMKPTLEIRAGFQFNIVVSKDINFPEPYEYGFTFLNTRR